MKGIIIYKGKYGATRQYADWLSEEFKLPAVPADDIMKEQLEDYDFFILGSSVYIGKLQLASWIKENIQSLTGKKIFFFLVSATPPAETTKLNEYINSGVPDQVRNNMEVYYLHGKMKIKELSWKDRFILHMGALLVKDPVAKKKMLTDFNEVKKGNLNLFIKDLETYLSSIQKKLPSKAMASLPAYF
jgi:menaquinone-dependent protoporphyrinogen IX oxidase